jgi:regulator of sigma E protease
MSNPWAFLLTIGVLVVVHEFGHYWVAKRFGVRVLRFSVGFGPILLRHRFAPGGTEFTLSALPLGGYVKMLDTREGAVADVDFASAFDRQSVRARACIAAAGPLANLLLAVLLFASSSWWGLEEPQAFIAQPSVGSLAAQAGLQAGDRISAVALGEGEWQEVDTLSALRAAAERAALSRISLSLQVSDPAGGHRRVVSLKFADASFGPVLNDDAWDRIGLGQAFSEPRIGEVKSGGPAQVAGLLQGDRVLKIDGAPIPDASTLRTVIRASAALPVRTMEWQVARGAELKSLIVEPRLDSGPDGRAVGRIDAMVGHLPALTVHRPGVIEGLSLGAQRTYELAALSLKTMGQMLVGQASLRNLSGPLTIADYAGQSVERGVAYYLGFLALVSVSLGVLNLLPLPLLDGGHLIYCAFEGLTGRPVSGLWLTWLQRGGALVLLLIMSVALSNDVARLLGLQ